MAEDKSDVCRCSVMSCLFRQQMNHTLNNGLCYMSVNGNCQLRQSKSNCPSTNLALLNLHLMFSPKLADLSSDYIILCRYTPYPLCKAGNDNYIIKTVSLITRKEKADWELTVLVMTRDDPVRSASVFTEVGSSKQFSGMRGHARVHSVPMKNTFFLFFFF